MRKCKNKLCQSPLPKIKDCTTPHQRARVCDSDCAYAAYLQDKERVRERARKAEDKAFRERKRAWKENDLPHQLTLTRHECNKLAKLLDRGRECISCGEHKDQMEAGRFRSVGSMASLRFDLRNIHLQCRACNQGGTMSYKRGRKPAVVSAEYEERLRARYGDRLVNWLNGPHEPKHYTCADLKDMRTEFAAERRRLEKGLPPSRDWRALPKAEEKAA